MQLNKSRMNSTRNHAVQWFVGGAITRRTKSFSCLDAMFVQTMLSTHIYQSHVYFAVHSFFTNFVLAKRRIRRLSEVNK